MPPVIGQFLEALDQDMKIDNHDDQRDRAKQQKTGHPDLRIQVGDLQRGIGGEQGRFRTVDGRRAKHEDGQKQQTEPIDRRGKGGGRLYRALSHGMLPSNACHA